MENGVLSQPLPLQLQHLTSHHSSLVIQSNYYLSLKSYCYRQAHASVDSTFSAHSGQWWNPSPAPATSYMLCYSSGPSWFHSWSLLNHSTTEITIADAYDPHPGASCECCPSAHYSSWCCYYSSPKYYYLPDSAWKPYFWSNQLRWISEQPIEAMASWLRRTTVEHCYRVACPLSFHSSTLGRTSSMFSSVLRLGFT